MENNTSSHSCRVGVSGHWSCLADSADADTFLITKPGWLLQLVLQEENRKNVPSHKRELMCCYKGLQCPRHCRLPGIRTMNHLCLLLGIVFGQTTIKMPVIVLLQFAPQARRHSGSQGGEGVGPGIRSWSHHSEGQGWTYRCSLGDAIPRDSASHGQSLQQPPKGTDPCQLMSMWAWEIPAYCEWGALSKSSSSQVYITVPSFQPGKIRWKQSVWVGPWRTLCLLGTMSKCLWLLGLQIKTY